jgi:hypothetical protein
MGIWQQYVEGRFLGVKSMQVGQDIFKKWSRVVGLV